MGSVEHDELPVRLVVTDDLARSRGTVFFRLLLAIPAWLMFVFWGLAAICVTVAAWFVLLVRGRCSTGLHEFLSAFVRYSTQLSAYTHLVADPYPGFGPKADYPVRLEIGPPLPQSRWSVFFRLFLAIPALMLASATGGNLSPSGPSRGSSYGASFSAVGAGGAVAVLGWFASLWRGRMPRGLRDLGAYGIGYSAQTTAYLLLLTDRYPCADPVHAGPMALPEHAVALEYRDDLLRSRLVTFFRLLLALPHLVWLTLWSIPAFLASVLGWLVAPFPGRLPRFLHRFLAAYVRYATHVGAFLTMVGGPFPGFAGAAGSYPVDVSIAAPARQGRWGLVLRGFLLLPAWVIAGAYAGLLFSVAFLGWWSSLLRGRMPVGMARIGAASLRYQAQFWAYAFLLTAQYPYSAPALEDTSEQQLSLLEPPEPAVAV